MLRSYGVQGFQAQLRRLCALAGELEALVLASEDFVLFTPRRFSLIVIRYVPPSLHVREDAEDVLEALNKAWYARLADRHDLQLTATVVGGKHCVRVAIGTPQVELRHVQNVWRIMQEEAKVAKQQLALKL